MLSKNELKYIQSLGHKKQRDEAQAFIAEGPKLAEEILNSDFEVLKIFATNKYLQKHESFSFPVTEVSEDELQKLSNLSKANQVLLLVKQKAADQSPNADGKMSIVLDAIQDPGNMGTIIRIADWFGINQIVCTIDCVELYNPKVVQATMGSLCRVNVWYGNTSQWLSEATVPVYGALLEGENIYSSRKVEEGILVIGNEGKGISEELKSFITHPVTIPRIGGAESLNAAVATAIIVGCMKNNS
ncbi:TrmH family RNA methyltransferase [Aridibaculum aurantiacum]|uniref:TrmH family RNA methyltransferase n=1 Tax=Aridibaculum aurantiacum TaxID=2810307 RepID=UPI001A95912F|nr:RNA methyltransferase [Aridibaculum aurantiacum]